MVMVMSSFLPIGLARCRATVLQPKLADVGEGVNVPTGLQTTYCELDPENETAGMLCRWATTPHPDPLPASGGEGVLRQLYR